MATESSIATTNANSTTPLFSYREIFQTRQKQAAVRYSIWRLMTVLGTDLTPALRDAWIENLEPYAPSQLAAGFAAAERSIDAFPSIAKFLRVLADQEFYRDRNWLYENLQRFGPDWKEIPARPERKERSLTEYGKEVTVPGREAQPAPDIPQRIRTALEIYGPSLHAALHRLASGLMEDQPNREFRRAWEQAWRMEHGG